jgi:hypothetical protein
LRLPSAPALQAGRLAGRLEGMAKREQHSRLRGEARCEGVLAWPPKARAMSSAPVGMKMTLDLPVEAIFCSVSRIRICAPRRTRAT